MRINKNFSSRFFNSRENSRSVAAIVTICDLW